jgi:hypothetical protein
MGEAERPAVVALWEADHAHALVAPPGGGSGSDGRALGTSGVGADADAGGGGGGGKLGGRTARTMSNAARTGRKRMKQAAAVGIQQARKEAQNLLYNYNMAESVLLFCGCLLLLSGLMFQSEAVQVRCRTLRRRPPPLTSLLLPAVLSCAA